MTLAQGHIQHPQAVPGAPRESLELQPPGAYNIVDSFRGMRAGRDRGPGALVVYPQSVREIGMRRMIILSAAWFALILMAATVLAQEEELKPEIFVPQIRHDFGKVFEQDKYEHDFIIQNRGKADLIIEKVKPG
jgi:hypothetical protein